MITYEVKDASGVEGFLVEFKDDGKLLHTSMHASRADALQYGKEFQAELRYRKYLVAQQSLDGL